MEIIKCEACGGNLEIPEGSNVIVCEYCGTKQILPQLNSEKTEDGETPTRLVINISSDIGIIGDIDIVDTNGLVKRAFLFLEEGKWPEANSCCDRLLNADPGNAAAYAGKLMAEMRVRTEEELSDCGMSYIDNEYYKKALRFADDEDKAALQGYCEANELLVQEKRRDKNYNNAESLARSQSSASIERAIALFEELGDYKDSAERVIDCRKKLEEAIALEEQNRIKQAKLIKKAVMITAPAIAALIVFLVVLNTVIVPSGIYNDAVAHMEAGRHNEAIALFESLGDYKDSKDKIKEVYINIRTENERRMEEEYQNALALLDDGKYDEAIIAFEKLGAYKDSQAKTVEARTKKWSGFVGIAAGTRHTVCLKKDGTVIAVGTNRYGRCDTDDWADIVAVSAGENHTVGLKSDGTVVTTGGNGAFQCNVSDWTGIIAISAGAYHTVGLKKDGTVVAVGENKAGQCDVGDWADIIAISAGNARTAGLTSSGAVIAVGDCEYEQGVISEWENCVDISAGMNIILAVRDNGSVLTANGYLGFRKIIDEWEDIVSISAGEEHVVGLRSDGSVAGMGYKDNEYNQYGVGGWKDISAISAGPWHTVGLKKDGTLVAIGRNDDGQCNVR